jgi:hypothetical protein
MSSPLAFHLVASVLYAWSGSSEQWEFELPVDGGPGRMRSGCDDEWRPWHPLEADDAGRLATLCRDTLANPDPGKERPSLPVDGSAMRLRLEAAEGGSSIEDMIPLTSWARPDRAPPASPLLRLVAAIHNGKWPDRAPLPPGRPPVPAVRIPPPDPLFAGMRSPEWPGRSSTGSVILPLREARHAPCAERLALGWLPFLPKKELHLTLLSSGEANELAAHLSEDVWRDAFEALHWTLIPSGKAVVLHENKPKGLEYSVVTPVECPALNAFRQRLSEASGAFLSPTQPHVTLWVRPKGRGIGISSTEQYQEFFVRELEPEEAAGFLEGTLFAPEPNTETL